MDVTDPQVWVMMGIFAAVMFSVIGVLHVMTARLIRGEISGLHGEIGGLRGEMRGGFEAVNHKIDSVEARLDAKIDGVESRLDAKIDSVEARMDAKIDGVEARLTTRIDALDKDMSAVTRRLMGGSDPQ